jgi:hypothetical protein
METLRWIHNVTMPCVLKSKFHIRIKYTILNRYYVRQFIRDIITIQVLICCFFYVIIYLNIAFNILLCNIIYIEFEIKHLPSEFLIKDNKYNMTITIIFD